MFVPFLGHFYRTNLDKPYKDRLKPAKGVVITIMSEILPLPPYSASALARLRKCGSKARLRNRMDSGVTSTSSSSWM